MTLNPVTIYKQIAALLKAKKEIGNMKMSELSTSEGRLHLIMQIIGIYSAISGFLPVALTAKLSVAALAAYSVSRAIVKAGEAIAKLTPNTKDDAIVAEANKVLDTVAPK